MWRERLNVSVSKAEYRIVEGLQRLGYNRYMVTQKGHKFHQHFDKVKGTRTDIEYGPPFNLCIFIDCVHIHDRYRQECRDELITLALEKRGFRVKRYRYCYPMSRKRQDEILKNITETLDQLGYQTHLSVV